MLTAIVNVLDLERWRTGVYYNHVFGRFIGESMFRLGINPNPVARLNQLAGSVNLDEALALDHEDKLRDFLVVVGLLATLRIIDPLKVTKSTFINATSVAQMVLTTEALISDKPEEKKEPAAIPPMPKEY